MRFDGIVACSNQPFRNKSTNATEVAAPPDLLQRDFTASAPNEVWVSDMTFLSTAQGWMHLCAILDLYSRRCVGWAVGRRPTAELATRALKAAILQRRPGPGLIFHSDRGSPYLSYAMQSLLDAHDMRMSVSRPGNCLDNAVAESFFKTLKTEMYYHRAFKTREEARQALFEFIEAFYNSSRLHSTLDYRSPDEYERMAFAA